MAFEEKNVDWLTGQNVTFDILKPPVFQMTCLWLINVETNLGMWCYKWDGMGWDGRKSL